MKVLGKADRKKYLCEVGHDELEMFLGLYYGNMNELTVGQEVDLGRGYRYDSQIKDAMNKTSDFINGNKKIIQAIMDGLTIAGRVGE